MAYLCFQSFFFFYKDDQSGYHIKEYRRKSKDQSKLAESEKCRVFGLKLQFYKYK